MAIAFKGFLGLTDAHFSEYDGSDSNIRKPRPRDCKGDN